MDLDHRLARVEGRNITQDSERRLRMGVLKHKIMQKFVTMVYY
jgi:hypothetical protein